MTQMQQKAITTTTDPISLITRCGLRPSPQRMAVASYLLTHRTHPTADEIFGALKDEYPTLSRTTVYNTLRALVAGGAVCEVTIDPGILRFDGYTEPHAHFRCTECKRIFDVEMTVPAPPGGFRASDVQVYMNGVCPQCSESTIFK